MRRTTLVAVVLGLSACGWVAYEPLARIPFDSRLGVQVMAGDPLIAVRVNAGAVGPSKLFVNVVQSRGRKSDLTTLQDARTEVYELDGASVRKLPDPPLEPSTPGSFATTWSPTATILRTSEDALALWDGARWKTLPPPPGDFGGDRAILVVDERHVLLEGQQDLAAFDGTSWVTTPVKGKLGPADPNGVRIVFADGRGLCTETLAWTTLQPQGAAVCTTNAMSSPVQPGLNGRVDDFQVIAEGALFHFSNGAWQRGAAVPSSSELVAAPGSLSVPLRQALAGPYPSHLVVRGGAITGLLSPQLNVSLDCACKRADDPSCGCVPLEVSSPLFFFLNDGSGLVSVTIPTVDAKRAVFARTLQLPLAESPWGPVCQRSCGAGERCEIQIGQSGTVSEVCASNDPMSSLPRARLEASVRAANPGTVSVAFASPDGGPIEARVVTTPPDLVVEGTPLAPVRITLTQEGHAPRVLEVRFPDASRTGRLGEVPLIGARFLSTEPPDAEQGWAAPVTSASAMLVPQVEPDAGVTWVAFRTAADGGLQRTPLAPGRAQYVAPAWLPRQHRVLVFGPTSVEVFDDVTLEPRGAIAGAGLAPEASASSLGDVALVSGTHLVRFEPQVATIVTTFSGVPSRALLSADGGVGLRSLGTSWQAVFADGSTRAMPTIPSSASPTLEASGRAAFLARSNQLIEVSLSNANERVVAPGANATAGGARSDRLVAAGSVQDGGAFTPFCDLYASGVLQGPFADVTFGRAVPGGGWLGSENGSLVLRTVDDGVSRDTLAGIDWRIVPLTDEGFAAVPSDQSQPTEVRYFIDGQRTATLARATRGAPFGPNDSRLISGRRVYRYNPTTGAVSEEWRVVDDTTSFTLDPVFTGFASVSAFPARPLASSRGLPCALFTTPHLEWSVANDGAVTRSQQGVDVFCAP